MNEQALKERIKHIAKLENRTFNQVWKDLAMERLLVRLSGSAYREKFIFKGGLLLARYVLYIGRETKDIDLQTTQLDISEKILKEIFMQICQIKVNDGFCYNVFNIEILNMEHMNYPGYRVDLNLTFGTMKDRIQVDVAVGDILEFKQSLLKLCQYRGEPIFEEKISLSTYPVETIFADKLESIIFRGSTNSRMKDYHDLLVLCREKNIFNFMKLKRDISVSLKKLSKPLPIKFSNRELNDLQKLWAIHQKGLYKTAERLNFPAHIKDVVNEINSWLLKNKIIEGI